MSNHFSDAFLSPHFGVGGHNQNISLNNIDYLYSNLYIKNGIFLPNSLETTGFDLYVCNIPKTLLRVENEV
jgi:hypothetical protein